ncbi:MAG: hemolysin family protein [Candidatus Ancillula sp.]|jgi:putative hemolysin|nr:hemolysin family protein [Candidatus Ancillula sp.]
MDFWVDLAIVFILTLVSGVFVAAEFALMQLRESQLSILEEKSKRGRIVAKVARDPNVFLSATQIGVTFVGFFSASFGADRLKPYIEPLFVQVGLPGAVASTVSLVVLIIFISYFSLVFGELIPKKIAIQNSLIVSEHIAPPVDKFALIMKPLIWLLSASADGVYRLFGGNPKKGSEEISEEELHQIVENHEALDDSEREIMSSVMEAADRSISEVMRPRSSVEFIDSEMTLADAEKFVHERQYSRFPVIGEDFDDVVGFVHVRDIFDAKDKKTTKVSDVVRQILKFPGTNRLFSSMKQMRRRGIHIAIVLDEYGGTDGICTLEDIIEEMIGDIHDEYDLHENPEVRTFKDGSFSVDGEISLSDFEDETGIHLDEGPYETVAGFILAKLGKIASMGDSVEVLQEVGDSDQKSVQKWLLNVTKIEKMRILRVKVKRM